MYTIPLKARKSNDSWSDPLSKGLGPSLRQMQRREKGERRRFIFSVSLFVLTVAGLIVAGTGGFIQEASAQQSYRSQSWNQSNNRFEWIWSGNSTSNSQNNQREESRTTTPTTQRNTDRTQQAPAPAQQQAPATTPPAPAPSQIQSSAPAAQTRTPAQTTVNQTPAQAATQGETAAQAENTAADIEAMAAAQASTEAKPVTYTSNQISTESRNRLLALAVSALTSGSLIFIMSLFGSTSTSPSVARYRKLGREVLAS